MESAGQVVVLTGSSGCLGHHTLKLLVGQDDEVSEIRCLDLRDPSKHMKEIIDKEQDESQKKFSTNKKIVWLRGDIRDVNLVEQVLDGAHCVIHCAAKMDIFTDERQQDVQELESINVVGTENLLKAAVRLGVSKFIHVSSMEIYSRFDSIYYATETTLPETKEFLFGASSSTKKEAEAKVKLYSNTKLKRVSVDGADSLNAVIIRLPAIYGEFDQHYVSKILEVAKFFGGTLRRLDKIWIRQQPIYAGNAAWSLIKAKQRMNNDQSISGEGKIDDLNNGTVNLNSSLMITLLTLPTIFHLKSQEFHITDDTTIGDPFDFLEPYLECRGMRVSKNSYSYFAVWIPIILFFALRRFLSSLDIFGLFTNKKSRLQDAIEKDKSSQQAQKHQAETESKPKKHWSNYATPATLAFMCNSSFLNRTKASLRLNYDPLIAPDEARSRSIDWYKNHLIL